MNFKEFQQQIIDSARDRACSNQSKRAQIALDLNDPAAFIRVLIHNHSWCIDSGIYNAAEVLSLDEQDILLRAGLRTQLNVPIDFEPVTVAGRLWKPFNEGATAENGIGKYMTFAQANDPKAGHLMPTENDFIALSTQKREWAIYQNQFGYLFDGRLFIPAGGYKEDNQGEPKYVGNLGYSWSSAVSGISGMYLSFHSGYLHPSYRDNRARGFQVRCLQE